MSGSRIQKTTPLEDSAITILTTLVHNLNIDLQDDREKTNEYRIDQSKKMDKMYSAIFGDGEMENKGLVKMTSELKTDVEQIKKQQRFWSRVLKSFFVLVGMTLKHWGENIVDAFSKASKYFNYLK